MSKSMATTLAVCSLGIAYLAYLYMRLIQVGNDIYIPILDITIPGVPQP